MASKKSGRVGTLAAVQGPDPSADSGRRSDIQTSLLRPKTASNERLRSQGGRASSKGHQEGALHMDRQTELSSKCFN